MNILFVLTPAFNPNAGGVQRTTFKLGKFFSEKNFQVTYYSTASSGHVKPDYGSLVYSTGPGGSKNKENIKHLEKTLHEVEPQIVINQMPYEKEIAISLFKNKDQVGYKLFGCLRNSLFNFLSNARDRMEQMLPKTVFELLDNPIGLRIVRNRHILKHRKQLRSILDYHDYFVLLSPPNREELEYFIGDYKSEKIISIPNSIPSVLELLPKKEKTILHVGRLNIQQKRSDLLIPVWEKVHSTLDDWNFIVVGDGPYFNKMKNDIQQKGLPRIKLVGFDKPESYYQNASIFLMPSAYEGFPNTLIEAQSYGTVPIVFDSYLALKWIIKTGENALAVKAFDVEQLSKELVNLATNEERLTCMARACLKNARRFTIDKVGEVWIDEFQRLVDDKDIGKRY